MNLLPKIELHLHLDCSLSYQVVARLAPSVSLAEYEREFVAPARCASLADFLTRAPRSFRLMQDRASLALVVEDLFEQLARDGVIYAEIRFAPLLHLEKSLSPEQVVETVDRATEASIRATGIEARLLLCTLRHFTREQSLQTVQLVDRFRGSRVAGLDIAGDEAGYPIEAHVPAFRYAAERGLDRTAHAGEACGPESVRETLRAFAPSRIGHGVRSIEDPELVEYLRRERIHLEVCPTSNVQTGVCGGYESHPIDRLYRAGISLGVNTDTRTITRITLAEEYRHLSSTFGWSSRELLQCNREAVRAAFIGPELRQRLWSALDVAYGTEALATAAD